ncbi:hypothetical protein HY632_01600 [Candidatus Uhrbacteria bacterium]|nr:hypothetical protein [Candidatus Uhrbacteria bacterium]
MPRISATFGILVVMGMLLLAPVQPVQAQEQCVANKPTPECKQRAASGFFVRNADCKCCGNCQLIDFVGLAIEVQRFIFGIAGSAALAMFVYGGFRWVTSAGSSANVETGRKAMVAAVIGMVIVFGAWVLVNFLLAALTGQVGVGPVKILGGEWWKVK